MSDFNIIAANLESEELDDAAVATFNIAGRLHDLYMANINNKRDLDQMHYYHHYFYGFLGGVRVMASKRSDIISLGEQTKQRIVAAGLWAVTDVVDSGQFDAINLEGSRSVRASFNYLSLMACIEPEEIGVEVSKEQKELEKEVGEVKGNVIPLRPR